MRLKQDIFIGADLAIESAFLDHLYSVSSCNSHNIEIYIDNISFFVVDGELQEQVEIDDNTVTLEYTETFERLEKLVNKKFRERQSELILENGDY